MTWYLWNQFNFSGSSERTVIARAMAEYRRHTCIRFEQRSNQRDYVYIYRGQG